MRTQYTVKELFDNVINVNDVNVITLRKGDIVTQCDNVESLADYENDKVSDYEIDFDSDEGIVYLDIIVE